MKLSAVAKELEESGFELLPDRTGNENYRSFFLAIGALHISATLKVDGDEVLELSLYAEINLQRSFKDYVRDYAIGIAGRSDGEWNEPNCGAGLQKIKSFVTAAKKESATLTDLQRVAGALIDIDLS